MFRRKRYDDQDLLHLHLSDISYRSQTRYGPSVYILLGSLFLTLLGLAFGINVPEITFYAECQNIPGGDICSISLSE